MPLPIHGDYVKLRSDIEIFIETGSYLGRGIQRSLDAGFKEIYSCEITKSSYEICVEKFSQNKNVNLYFESSEQFLPRILENINSKFVLWLDAHGGYSGASGDPIGVYLPKELEMLINYKEKFKDSIIMIDDMNYIPQKELIENELKKIKPNSSIDYLNGYIIECNSYIQKSVLICK